MALRISASNTSASSPVADWPSAPSAAYGIVQLKSGRVGEEAGAWLLSETALFFVSVPAMTKPKTTDEFRAAAMPTFNRVAFSPGSANNLLIRHLAVSEDAKLVALIGQNHDGAWELVVISIAVAR